MQNIKQAIDGYKNFRRKYFGGQNQLFETLKKGQNPRIMAIACSDSRVDPAIIMDCEPGDLFVVRNVANLIPPYEDDDQTYHGTSAALEFAVCGLEVENIVVIGHSKCGGIGALVGQNLTQFESSKFIKKWMQIAAPAFDKTHTDYKLLGLNEQIEQCSHLALVNSLDNLMTFPWIKSRVEKGKLNIYAWYFDLDFGRISSFNPESKKFEELNSLI